MKVYLRNINTELKRLQEQCMCQEVSGGHFAGLKCQLRVGDTINN